jgi:hypothetical protein
MLRIKESALFVQLTAAIFANEFSRNLKELKNMDELTGSNTTN